MDREPENRLFRVIREDDGAKEACLAARSRSAVAPRGSDPRREAGWRPSCLCVDDMWLGAGGIELVACVSIDLAFNHSSKSNVRLKKKYALKSLSVAPGADIARSSIET